MSSLEIVVPGTALLVPGVAGRAEVLAPEREQVLAALRAALPGAREVLVRTAGASGPGRRTVPDLGSVGVARGWHGWAFHGNDDAPDGVAGLAASVALLALGAAGWTGPVTVVEPAEPRGPGAAHGGDAVVVVTTDAAPAGVAA